MTAAFAARDIAAFRMSAKNLPFLPDEVWQLILAAYARDHLTCALGKVCRAPAVASAACVSKLWAARFSMCPLLLAGVDEAAFVRRLATVEGPRTLGTCIDIVYTRFVHRSGSSHWRRMRRAVSLGLADWDAGRLQRVFAYPSRTGLGRRRFAFIVQGGEWRGLSHSSDPDWEPAAV